MNDWKQNINVACKGMSSEWINFCHLRDEKVEKLHFYLLNKGFELVLTFKGFAVLIGNKAIFLYDIKPTNDHHRINIKATCNVTSALAKQYPNETIKKSFSVSEILEGDTLVEHFSECFAKLAPKKKNVIAKIENK